MKVADERRRTNYNIGLRRSTSNMSAVRTGDSKSERRPQSVTTITEVLLVSVPLSPPNTRLETPVAHSNVI